MADSSLNIFDIDPEKDEAELRSYFKELTKRDLYPAQDEAIMLSVINHQSTLNQVKYATSLKNLFIRYASGIWLDLIGDFYSTPRHKATTGKDVLRVKLYEPFETEKILPKNSEVETKDGLYVFFTLADLVIPAGEIYGEVEIESELVGAMLNDYGKGDINSLIKNYEYIESVENINGVSGASDAEDDDSYRERLLIAPEKLSTAGTEDGYKYFSMSAHKDITDITVDLPQKPATVEINDIIYTAAKNGKITSDKVNAIVNYKTGKMELTFTEPVSSVKICIEPAATIEIYALTKDGEASQTILDTIEKELSPSNRRPLTDNVLVYSAIKADFTVDATIKLSPSADYETTEKSIREALENYFTQLKSKLGMDVIKSQIIALINDIDGVYSVDVTSPANSLTGDKKQFFNGKIGTLKIERAAA